MVKAWMCLLEDMIGSLPERRSAIFLFIELYAKVGGGIAWMCKKRGLMLGTGEKDFVG